jgi:membrane dipeptidase
MRNNLPTFLRASGTRLCLLMAPLLFLPAKIDAREARTDWSEERLMSYAREIHTKYLTLDTHLDVPIVLRRPGFDISQEHSWPDHASQVDFPRMVKGGLDGGFFVVFVRQGPLTPEMRADAIDNGKMIAELIRETVATHSEESGFATTHAEALALKAQGKRVVFMGIENGYAIGRNLDLMKTYYDLGVRYFGVTHTKNNDLADSSTDASGNKHMGLSELGRAAVDECNRLGIMVDVSHASDKTTWDILERSKAPVIASHSGCYAEYPHPRNLNDPLLKEIAARDGVVQMNMFSGYMMEVEPNEERIAALGEWVAKYRSGKTLTPAEAEESLVARIAIEKSFPKALSDVKTVVDHIDHMVDVMGIDHVGLSGDFDGGGGVNHAMDVGEMMNITVEMLRRGYLENELEKFWGGNVMRVLSAVQAVAETMQKAASDSN